MARPRSPVRVREGDPESASSLSRTISSASARLRDLAQLSGTLTDALNPAEAAQVVQEQALTTLGATSAIIVTLGTFPPRIPPESPPLLHLVHAIAVPDDLQQQLREIALDAPVPYAEVARTGESKFMQSRAQISTCGEWGQAMIDAGVHACAIVPVWANGELRGVLGLSWPTPRVFDDDERAFVSTLGVMCAQAILRAHLRDAELKARENAELANESKANFLTMISHELRTPMNAVMGYGDLIARGIDGPLTTLQSEHLSKIQSSSAHLLALIEELLGFARLEAGRDVVNPEPVELLEVIESTLLLIRPLAEAKQLQLSVKQPDDPIGLYTDIRKLRQILLNVLANAVKYTDAGGVTLIVRIEGAPGAAGVVFEITDTGPGMSQETQTHVFDAFWQKDPNSVLSSGTGLGLPIARQLARLLGGDVALLRSDVPGGSAFIVSVPIRYSKEADATA